MPIDDGDDWGMQDALASADQDLQALRAERDRLRSELSRAAVREGELQGVLDSLLPILQNEARHRARKWGEEYASSEIRRAGQAMDSPSPLAEAAQEVLEASFRELEAEDRFDRAETPKEVKRTAEEWFQSGYLLREKQIRYRALLEGRGEG